MDKDYFDIEVDTGKKKREEEQTLARQEFYFKGTLLGWKCKNCRGSGIARQWSSGGWTHQETHTENCQICEGKGAAFTTAGNEIAIFMTEMMDSSHYGGLSRKTRNVEANRSPKAFR